ncbi:MAG: hypothetical protein R3Y13_03880 [bacterium]
MAEELDMAMKSIVELFNRLSSHERELMNHKFFTPIKLMIGIHIKSSKFWNDKMH